jgi:hypothetical protein
MTRPLNGITPSDEAVKLHGYEKDLPEVRAIEAKLLEINPGQIGEITRWVRRAVYMLGLDGGYEGILKEAKEAANREQREIDKLQDPLNQEDYEGYRGRLHTWRTFLAMRALSIVSEARQKAVMGNINARFRTQPQPERIARYYFNEKGRLIKEVNKKTPLDELLDVIAFTDNFKYLEYETEERKFDAASLEAMRRAAQASLITILMSDDRNFIEVARQFLTYEDYTDMLARSPGALSEGRIGKKAANMYLGYAVLEKPIPEFDAKFAMDENLGRVKQTDLESARTILEEAATMPVGERMRRRDEIFAARELVESAEKKGVRRLESILKGVLEENNSFFIGSELMKELITHNQDSLSILTVLKYLDEETLNDEDFMKDIEERVMVATFPPHLERQLKDLYEGLRTKTGGKPVFVRSSSALEDQAGASFAGMYESIICSGDDFEKFLESIKKVFISVFNPKVIRYRKNNGLIDNDESMGLLVQEANGRRYGQYFLPDIAGVGLSHAPQSAGPDPGKGMMTVAAGFGEKVVKSGGKIFWFANPHFNFTVAGGRAYAQSDVCVFDGKTQTLKYVPVDEVLSERGEYFDSGSLRDIFTDENGMPVSSNLIQGKKLEATFKGILDGNPAQLPLIIRYFIAKLEYALGYKVDIEFTAERQKDGKYKVKLVQCRPQNIAENLRPASVPEQVSQRRILMKTASSLCSGHAENIRYALYIDPEVYGSEHPDQLSHDEMKQLRQWVAKINNKMGEKDYVIIAPGRWGDNPASELGINVIAGDYDRTAGIVEVVGAGHWKDVPPSAGTHDYQLIIERGISTMSVNLKEEADGPQALAAGFLEGSKNHIEQLIGEVPPRLSRWLKVVDAREVGNRLTGVEKEWRFNIAMSNLPGSRGSAIYLAEEGKDSPELKGV